MNEHNLEKYDLAYLERQVHNMTKLIEINGIINSTLDIVKLLTYIMEIIKDIMETEASTLLLYEAKTDELVFKVALSDVGEELQERYRIKIGQGIAGWVAEHRRVLYVNDVYNDYRFDPNFDKNTGFTTRAMLCAPLLFKGKLLGVIQAINPVNRPAFTEEDLGLFKSFATQSSLAVQNAIFFQNALEEERIKNELASAQTIQESLLPAIDKGRDGIHISARSVKARELGGEFYDVLFEDDGSIRVALGDIHGRGIPGAFNAAMINGLVRALARLKGKNPAVLFRMMNTYFLRDVQTVKNLSLFYGVIRPDNRTIQFVNAGFAYPLLVRGGIARYLKFGARAMSGNPGGNRRVEVRLQSGDVFVIVTDGILNLKNKNGQRLGLKRVMDFLGGNRSSDIADALIRFSQAFVEGLEKREDFSIIAFRVE